MPLVATGQAPIPLRAWASIRLLLWYFGAQFGIAVLILLVPAIVPIFSGGPPGDLSSEQFLVAFAAATLCGGVVTLMRLRRNLPGGAWPAVLAAIGWRESSRNTILGCVVLGSAMAYLYTNVLMARFFPPTSQDISTFSELFSIESVAGRATLFLFAAIFAPALEEFMFRGILLSGLGNSWGTMAGVIGSTAFFSLGHLEQVGSYWPAFVGIIGVAFVACYLRLRYRSLFPGIAMHAAYNATLLTFSFFSSS